jgi:siroheme synthase-like protein
MWYPIFLDLRGRPVVVVGGGTVAARKTRGLLAANAAVTVVSPAVSPLIQRLAKAGRLKWVRRRYRAGDLRGAHLAVAATDDQAVNARVCAEARRRRALVNCVAPPAAGDFIVPSVLRRCGLAIAISTGGASPALARHLRRELEQYLRGDYARIAQTLRGLRRKMNQTATTAHARAATYRRAVRDWAAGRTRR